MINDIKELREEFGDQEGIQRSMGMLAICLESLSESDFINLFSAAGFDMEDQSVRDEFGKIIHWFESEGVFLVTGKLLQSIASGDGEYLVESINNENMQDYILKLKSDGQLIRNGL